MNLAIVDLGCGNVGSVSAAFSRLGAAPMVTSERAAIAGAERLVLPGVGAAGHAMARIDALGLSETLVRFARPLLGICLGMQLLFEGSAEDDTPCLGLLPGRSRRLEPAPGRPLHSRPHPLRNGTHIQSRERSSGEARRIECARPSMVIVRRRCTANSDGGTTRLAGVRTRPCICGGRYNAWKVLPVVSTSTIARRHGSVMIGWRPHAAARQRLRQADRTGSAAAQRLMS